MEHEMTKAQMMMKVASIDAVNWIGKDDAEAIFNCLLNEEKPSGDILMQAAYLGHAIGMDDTRAIFDELMSY